MISPLTQMQIKRVLDTKDVSGYARVPGAQVYSQPGVGIGPARAFLQVERREGQWWIGPGYVEGTKINGSDWWMPTGRTIYVACTYSREFGSVQQADGEPISYLTGRYSIQRAWLSTRIETDVRNLETQTTSRLVMMRGADGSPPPGYLGTGHFFMDPASLTF